MKIHTIDSTKIVVMLGKNIIGESYPAVQFDLDEISGIYLAVDDTHNNNIMKKCLICKYDLNEIGVLIVGNHRSLLMAMCDECLHTNIATLPDNYPITERQDEIKNIEFMILKGSNIN